jgi:hypothetical protein
VNGKKVGAAVPDSRRNRHAVIKWFIRTENLTLFNFSQLRLGSALKRGITVQIIGGSGYASVEPS